jgi:enediyne biosynthesis thioesterase
MGVDTVALVAFLMRAYEYRHTVLFEETNLIGNVYYVNHVRWQGRVREMFLRQFAPDILRELDGELILTTLRCSCEYLDEIRPFDEVLIRMSLAALSQTRITLRFEYLCERNGAQKIVALGEQQIACMGRRGQEFVPKAVPQSLREALAPFTPEFVR